MKYLLKATIVFCFLILSITISNACPVTSEEPILTELYEDEMAVRAALGCPDDPRAECYSALKDAKTIEDVVYIYYQIRRNDDSCPGYAGAGDGRYFVQLSFKASTKIDYYFRSGEEAYEWCSQQVDTQPITNYPPGRYDYTSEFGCKMWWFHLGCGGTYLDRKPPMSDGWFGNTVHYPDQPGCSFGCEQSEVWNSEAQQCESESCAYLMGYATSQANDVFPWFEVACAEEGGTIEYDRGHLNREYCVRDGEDVRLSFYYRKSRPGVLFDSPSECNANCYDDEVYIDGQCYAEGTCPEGMEFSEEFGCQAIPEDTGPKCPLEGNPIQLEQGNKYQTEVDFIGNGILPLSFSRFYNSRSLSKSTYIGTKWSHSYNYGIKPMEDVTTIEKDFIGFHLYRGTGRNIKFSPEAGQSTDHPVVLSDEIIEGDKTLRTATYKNGTVETYEMSLDETTNTMSVGRLISIRNIQGFTQTLNYNAEGQLQTVVDDNGNTLAFAYNANGQMETMTDPDSNVYTYVYEGDLLVSVIYPDLTPDDDNDNPSKIYRYEDTRFPTALTGITNEKNVRYSTWEYDDNGRAYISKHAGDSGIDETSIAFNADGSRTVTNPLGKQTTYHFITVNDNMRVERVEGHPSASCGGTNRGYTYNANGFIETKTDWNGNTTFYVRDNMGRIEQKTVAYGTAEVMTTAYQYHPTLKLKTQIDLHKGEGIASAPIKSTSIAYYGDEAGEEYWQGLVKSRTVTDPTTGESRTTSYTYYGEGELGARQLKTVDGPRDDVQDITTYTYDAKGNLKTTTNALGHVSEITEYDGASRPLTILDQNQVETVLTYTPRGWLDTSTKQGALTQYIYDAVGNVTDIIAPDGSTITYQYDDANRLTDIFDKHGNNIHYDLNNMGGITGQQIKDPSGTLTMVRTTVRDELNRIKHSIGANVEEDIETNYDDNGNVDNTVDAYQRVTDNSFDALNRITHTKDTADGITVTRYDDYGNIEEVEDPRGLITIYNYNALGDLKQLTSPDTGITTYTYDSAGNVKTQAGANNITVTYIYDALNRLTDVTYPDSSENIHYGYDDTQNQNYGIGRLTSISDQSGTIEYKYNAKGLVSDEIRTIAGTAYSFGYQFNPADKLTHITYPSGMIVEYIRDDAGKIVGVTATKDGQITTLADSIQYKPFGPQTNLQFGNGYIQTNSYNQNYQLENITTPNVLSLDYAYDYMGNITGMQDMLDSLFDQDYALDNLYRLDTAAGEYGVIDYDLDATGNRIAITEDGFSNSYTVDPTSNRIDNIGDTSFGYDAEGNTTSKITPNANWVYGYNQNGRLQTVTKDGTQVAQYIYNALGQRTQKITEAGTTTQIINSTAQLLVEESAATTKEFIYLGGQVLASYTTVEDVQPEPQPGPCPGTTATNSQHESAGRAYSESETTGQTCFGTFCWGGTTTTTWYATGSNENLGTSSSTSTTLYENGTNNWQTQNPNNCVQIPTGPCESITSSNQEHTQNNRAYTTTQMVGQTCWGTFCFGGTEQTVYKAQGSDDELGTEATTQTTLFADPNGKYYLNDPETCPVEIENPHYQGWAYYHNDHLGTPRVVTDANGEQLWKGDYNPFGKVKETIPEGVIFEQSIRFPGQVEDSETGLYYNYYRYYDPSLGRYITSDLIGLEGGINTYAYVEGNPVIYIDPDGLQKMPYMVKELIEASICAVALCSGSTFIGTGDYPEPKPPMVEDVRRTGVEGGPEGTGPDPKGGDDKKRKKRNKKRKKNKKQFGKNKRKKKGFKARGFSYFHDLSLRIMCRYELTSDPLNASPHCWDIVDTCPPET